MTKQKVLVIAGPTAVGKTSLSIRLAQMLDGELISGDSLQVYKGLDIGTAKATAIEQAQAVHHLIDIRDFYGSYSASDFQKEGRQAIAEIAARKKLPIVVGGTGLYIQALLYDFKLGGEKETAHTALREKYEQYAQVHGNQALWTLLQARDPLAGAKIHFNNRRKVIRALEVFETTGSSILQPQETPELLYEPLIIGLTTERALLYERINLRVEQMLAHGLLEEARLLYEQPQVQAAQAIGYKELFPYLAGEQELSECLAQLQQNSRRYAKRQLTWFRNRLQVQWFDLIQQPETFATLTAVIADWMK